MRKAFIAGALFGALLFIAAVWMWGAPVKAGVKDEPKGLPKCTQMTWEVAGQTRIFEVWYTERMFVVRDHGPVCLGPQCDKKNPSKDEEGLLLPPPKDVKKKLGM